MTEPSVGELYKLILESTLPVEDKKAMLNEVRKLGAFTRDRWIYRTVVWILGGVAIVVLILPFRSMAIPEGVLTLAATALGALAAFLSPNVANRPEASADTADVLRAIGSGQQGTQLAQANPAVLPAEG